MPDEDPVTVDIDGLAVDEAVDVVLEADPSRDADTVRSALRAVAEGGVVSQSAVDAQVSDVARAVSRAGSSLDAERMAFLEASEAADPVADLDAVAARREALEADLEALAERRAALQDRLETLSDRAGDPDRLAAAALGVAALQEDAAALDEDTDDFADAVAEFQHWLDHHETRVADLRADLDALAGSLQDLDAVADALDDGASGLPLADPGVAWFDASLQVRTTSLMLADTRAEAADLRAWAEREGLDADDLSTVAERIDDLAAERERIADRLADVADPAWTEKYADRLEEFAADLDDMEPPVDWAAVEDTLAGYRPGETGAESPEP